MSKNNDYTDYTSFGEKWVNQNSSNGSSPKNDFTNNTETSSGIFGNQTNDFIQSQINKSVGSNVNDNLSSGQDDMTLERTRDYVNNFVNQHTGNPIDNSSSSSNQNNEQQNNGYSPSQPNPNNFGQKQSYSNGSNGYTPTVNNVSTAQAEQIQKMVDVAIPTYAPKIDITPSLSRYDMAFNIQQMAQHSDVISGSTPFRDAPHSINTDAHFDMNKSYGGYNYGNNNPTANSGFSGNSGNPTFVTFDNANNYVSFGGTNWNYTTNNSNDINEPIKVANPQTKPIYNYQADNYSNGPFGNMNNAYGGQNLLLNPNMFAGRMGEASYFEKGLHLTDRVEETLSDRQGQHTDRGVGTVKGGVAQTIAAMPINEVVNLYRQSTKQNDVRNYYNTNNIADNYKVSLGSKVNSAEATKKYNDYVAKCTKHGAKPMEYDKFLDAGARGEKIDIKDTRGVKVDKVDLSDNVTKNMFANAKLEVSSSENISKVSTKYREYVSKCNAHGIKAIDYDKFLNKGAKGSVINIKDKNGNILDKVDLSDNKTRNVFANAKIETDKFTQIAHKNDTVANYGRGKTSNYDFNQMRQKNYEQLNRKMKLDGFKGTDKQMKMLRAKDRKLDKNNMFKDLSDADIKEIEDFVETNGANLGVFNSRAVNSQSAKGRSLVANKLMDDRTGDGFRTTRTYTSIATTAAKTSIKAGRKVANNRVQKALDKLERNYKAGNISLSSYNDKKDVLKAKGDVLDKQLDLDKVQKRRGRIDKRKTQAYKEKKKEIKDLKNVRKDSVKKQRRNRRDERRSPSGNRKSWLQRKRDYHKEYVKEYGKFPHRLKNNITGGIHNIASGIKNIPKKIVSGIKSGFKAIGKIITKFIVPILIGLIIIMVFTMIMILIMGIVANISSMFSWGSDGDDNLDNNQFQTLNTIATQYENETLIPNYKNAAKDGADLTGLYSGSDNWNKNVYSEVDITDITDENNHPTNFCNCLQIFTLYSYYRQQHNDWQSDNPQKIFDQDIKNIINSTHGYDNVTYTDVYHNDLSGCDNIKYHSDLVYSKANYYDANKTYTYNYNGYEWTATGYLDTQKFANDFSKWSANCVNRNNNNAANYTKTITDDGTDTYKYTVTLNRTEQVPVYREDPVYEQQWVTKYETSTVISAASTSLKQGLWVQSSSNSLSTKNSRGTISNKTDWSSLTAKERHNKSNKLYTQKELQDLGFSISAPSGNPNSSWYSGGLGEYIYYRPVCASNGKYQLIAYKFKDVSGYETVQTGTQQVLDHYDPKPVTEVLTYPIPTITYKCKGHCAGHVKVAMDLTNKSDIRNINNIMGLTIPATRYNTLSEDEIKEVEEMIGTYDTHYVDGVTNWKEFNVYFMGAEGWMDDEAIKNVVNSLGTITTNNGLVPAGGGAPGIINAGTTEGKQELINQGLSLCNGAFVYGHSGRGNLYATGGNTDCSGYVSRCIFQALKAQGVPDDDPRMVAIKQVPVTVNLLKTCPNGYAAIGGDVSKLAPGTVIVRQNQSADAGSNGTTGLSNHTMIYIGPMDVDGDGQMDDGGKPYVLECTTSGGKSGPMFHTRNWSYLNAYGYYCNWL